ncbi:MAG: peroxide stress protein YaaA [Caldilineaceae bacterium]
MDALRAAVADPAVDPAKLFGVRARRWALTQRWRCPPGRCCPASQRYTGVMFDHLACAEMETRVRTAFNKRAVLFSGLWGLLRARLDHDYKLKMDASLRVGPLATYWRPHISAVLNPLAARKVVWICCRACMRAWDGKTDYAARWQVKFVEEKGGKLRTVTHWSKALKGALIRCICANRVTDPAALRDFRHPEGYIYRPEQSDLGSGGTLLFVK